MRQKTFIKQTSLAILLYFICLALAVAIDLFQSQKYVSYTCLSGYLCRLGLLGAYQKDKTIWSNYLSGYLYVPLLLCL